MVVGLLVLREVVAPRVGESVAKVAPLTQGRQMEMKMAKLRAATSGTTQVPTRMSLGVVAVVGIGLGSVLGAEHFLLGGDPHAATAGWAVGALGLALLGLALLGLLLGFLLGVLGRSQRAVVGQPYLGRIFSPLRQPGLGMGSSPRL